MRPRRRTIRWRTIPFRVVTLLVGVLMTYLVVINALFVTGIAKIALNSLAPAHAHFEWRSAYSPWFLRVHVEGFVFRGEDSAVQWVVTADEAQATLGGRDFFARRVRLHDTRAHGVTTRIRFKLDPAEATAARVATLPSIEGFANPPLKPAVPPPVDDRHYHLWTIQIDDATMVDVREVWVDSIRVIDTHGFAKGGFYLKPQRGFYVRPTEVRTDGASVYDGKNTIASELRGTFGLRLSEIDPRFDHGLEILRNLDASARGEGNVGDLRFLDRWLHAARISVAGGAGATQFDVEVHRGKIASGSRAWARHENVQAWSGRDGISATALVSASVPRGERHIALAVETHECSIHRDATRVVDAPTIFAAAQIDNVDLSRPFDRWAMSIDVPIAKASRLEALNAYFDEPMLRAGAATVSGHASITPENMSGHATLDVTDASVELRKTLVTASGRAKVTLHDYDFRSHRGDVAGARLVLRDVSGGDERGFWADVSASPLAIDLDHGAVVSGTFTGKVRNAQLPLTILGAPGIVHTVFGSQGFTTSARIRVGRGETDISGLRAIGNSIDVRAHYHQDEGAVLVETPLMNVGILVRNGETSTRLFASRSWYTRTLRAEDPLPVF